MVDDEIQYEMPSTSLTAYLSTPSRPLVDPSFYEPSLGTPIRVQKTDRPGTCSQATRHLRGLVAVETKYDGER